MTLPLGGLADVAGNYDGFIIDLWGVIHDGFKVFPHALDVLERLRQGGKRTLMLSNAPKPVADVVKRMEGLGIARECYDDLMTSGEAVRAELATRADEAFAKLGRRLFHLGPVDDEGVFVGLDYEAVPVEEADFILNTGPAGFGDTVDNYARVLAIGIERSLPMVCANPDLMIVAMGQPVVCAGAVAKRYQDMGGHVIWRGKPDPVIYDQALALLGTSRERTLCIGDGMLTDIKGAIAAGMDSVLVGGGIHATDLGETISLKGLDLLVQRFGVRPSAVMTEFRW